MKNLYFIAVLMITTLWYSCTKEERSDYVDPNAPAPAQISGVAVHAGPGSAKLTYKIPRDPNLSYVKAVYEIQPGVFREAKSSIYTDTLALVGFGDTSPHEVKLYSVGKNEKSSEPLIISVSPETPPVAAVFETIEFKATFGGVNVAFRNDYKANLSLVVMVDTTGQNTWAPVTTYYTAAPVGNFSARGYASVEKKFAIFIKDRWNNKSDTLIKTLTPIFETEIPKNTWVSMRLTTDSWKPVNTGYSIEKLWDGSTATLQSGFASPNGSAMPSWFTIDLGKKVLLSRFKEFQAPSSHLYVASAVKTFELYGSNSPDADGGWTQWQLLGTFHSFKPSGLPMGQTSAEDKNYANVLGEDFEFEIPPPAVRYLRWKTLETYSSTGQVVISELSFWGQIQP